MGTDDAVILTAQATPSDAYLTWGVQWEFRYREYQVEPWGPWLRWGSNDDTVQFSSALGGVYQFRAKYGSGDEGAESSPIRVVKVDALQCDRGYWLDDGDGNPRTNTVAIPLDSGDVIVTARSNPILEEEQLPSSWTLDGGDGVGKLTRTVTNDLSQTVITCTCGSSSQTLTIIPYRATFILAVEAGNWLDSVTDWGHAWWRFDLVPTTLLDYPMFAEYARWVGQPTGFWPVETNISPWNLSSDGQVTTNGQGVATDSRSWTITLSQLHDGVAAVDFLDYNCDIEEDYWDAWWFNCTDAAVGIAEAMGISTIDASSNPTTPGQLLDWMEEED